MTDLTVEYYWHCTTSENWATAILGSRGDTYTVKFNSSDHKNPDVQRDYSCDCLGYKYGGDEFGNWKYCKHIKQVLASGKHCKWMQFVDGGDAVVKNGEQHCPECGERANSMAWGV